MAGFVAEGVVDPLDFDFRTKASPDAPHGTIPEPSDKQIAAFLAGMKEMATQAKDDLPADVDLNDPSAMLAALDDLDPEVMLKMTAKMSEVFAKLCSGTPSAQQIGDLPPRIRSIFFSWLRDEVMAPEAATGGGTAQVTNLHSARAG